VDPVSADERQPRRAGSMSDTDRALRRRTPARGVPAVERDEESTPPPQEPPRPVDLLERLDVLDAAVRDAIGGVARVWGARDLGERIDQVDEKLGAVAKSANQTEALVREYLGPQLQHWRAVTDGIAQQLPQLLTSTEALGITMRNLDDRLRNLEVSLSVSIGKLAANADAVAARVTVLEHSQAAQALRIIELEKREHGRDAAGEALTKSQRNQVLKLAGGGGGIAGVIGWLVNYLTR